MATEKRSTHMEVLHGQHLGDPLPDDVGAPRAVVQTGLQHPHQHVVHPQVVAEQHQPPAVHAPLKQSLKFYLLGPELYFPQILEIKPRTTVSLDVQTRFPVQLAFAKFLSKIKGNFWGSAVSMILALY